MRQGLPQAGPLLENDPKGQWRVMERRRHCSKEYYSVAHYCVQLEPDPTGDPLRSRVARASLEKWMVQYAFISSCLSVGQGLLHGVVTPFNFPVCPCTRCLGGCPW